MSFGKKSTAADVATHFQDEIRGKNVLVTGVSPDGLGAEVVRTLAPYANLIVAAARSSEKIAQTLDAVRREVPSANLRPLIIDLDSLASVRGAAAEVSAYTEPIHILINNGAVGLSKDRRETKDGFESQFGSNYLAHFLFTNLILPRLKLAATASYPSRIVNVSSEAHRAPGGEIRWDDPNYLKRLEEYSKFGAYGQSKTAIILISSEFAKRLVKDNILSYSLHPGVIVTNMALGMKQDLIAFGVWNKDGTPVYPDQWKTIPEGAATHIVAAFDPSIKGQSGSYLVDCKVQSEERSPWASKSENATKLWNLSEDLLGESFSL